MSSLRPVVVIVRNKGILDMTKRALLSAAYYAGLVNKLAEKKAQLAYRGLPQRPPAFPTQPSVKSMHYAAKPSVMTPGSPTSMFGNGMFASNIPGQRAPVTTTARTGSGSTVYGGGGSGGTIPPAPGSSYGGQGDPGTPNQIKNKVMEPVKLPSGKSVAEATKAQPMPAPQVAKR